MPFNIFTKPTHNQKKAIKWLNKRVKLQLSGLIIAPTGFGKTLLSFFIHIISQSKLFSQTIIVVPNINLIKQFQNQFITHTDQTSHEQFIFSFHGSKRNHDSRIAHTPIIISTYATLRQEFKNNREHSYIFNNSFHNIILDEAHKGLAKTTNVSWQTIHAIHSKFVWPLSATPIVNKTKDIASIAALADIHLPPSDIINHHSFSCPKDISNIPSKFEYTHFVHASGNQLFNYRSILHQTSANVLAKISALRISATHHLSKHKSILKDNLLSFSLTSHPFLFSSNDFVPFTIFIISCFMVKCLTLKLLFLFDLSTLLIHPLFLLLTPKKPDVVLTFNALTTFSSLNLLGTPLKLLRLKIASFAKVNHVILTFITLSTTNLSNFGFNTSTFTNPIFIIIS